MTSNEELNDSRKYFTNAKNQWKLYYNNFFRGYASSRPIARREIFEYHPNPKDVVFTIDNDIHIKCQDTKTNIFSEAILEK